jgi:ribosomal protein S18 acetylase RimI-like enzyme
MRDDEFSAFLAESRRGYVEQMVEYGGRPRDVAEAKADADHRSLFPEGRPGPGHHVYVAEAAGARVGRLWLSEHGPGWPEGTAFVYDIEVEEAARGRGFGRAIMVAAEQVARSLGARELALNVFGGNTAAIALYTSLGYAVTAQQMRKEL